MAGRSLVRWRPLLLPLLLAAALLLAPPGSPPPAGPALSAWAAGDGLALALRVPRGPYFVGELLPITVSLTNRTAALVFLGRGCAARPPGNLVGVLLTGGTAASLALPPTDHSCPPLDPVPVPTGKKVVIRLLVPLSRSADVTLAVEIVRFTVIDPSLSGRLGAARMPDPFGGRWPMVQLTVTSQPPAARIITLRHVGPTVLVAAPAGARASLHYLYGVTCREGQGSMARGYYAWEPLSAPVLRDPGCGPDERWQVAVGAPGYAIATTTYGS